MQSDASWGQNFSDIVHARRSIRGFTSDPIPMEVMTAVFGDALRAPSNCNTQPWFVHVVTGERLEALREELPKRFTAGDIVLDFPFDGQYEGAFQERQHASAKVLYDALGIARDDKAGRHESLMRNFSFFNAPAVAFFTLPAGFGVREACDLGMFAQTVMLGLTARGLGSCPQTALSFLVNVLRPALQIPDEQKLLFGLSFGYPDDNEPANTAITERAPLSDLVTFHS